MNKKFIGTTLGIIGLTFTQIATLPQQQAQAAQSFTCEGNMNNGWGYSAKFVDGRFTEIRWSRSGQPPQTSTLTYKKQNAQDQPVYQGSFQGATLVTLVDLSGGNVTSGSQIEVSVEEWGNSKTTCGTGSTSSNKLSCEGSMNNGWNYLAQYANGKFTNIRWTRSGQPPQTTDLRFDRKNSEGNNVYRGSFQGATLVTLVDFSGGNVTSGSQIRVTVEEWGNSQASCF